MQVKVRSGTVGWVCLVALILGIDLIAVRTDGHTLSYVFRTASKHPIKKWIILTVWTYITMHLFFDYKYDPFKKIGILFESKNKLEIDL